MLAHIVIELGEYDIKFIPRSSIKAQTFVDLIVKFSHSLEVINNEDVVEVHNMEVKYGKFLWMVLTISKE